MQPLVATSEALIEPPAPGAVTDAEHSAWQVDAHNRRASASQACQEEQCATPGSADLKRSFRAALGKNFAKSR
jgi:hypothetical protein